MGTTSKKWAITAAALVALTLGLVSACAAPEEPETERGPESVFFFDPIQLSRATNIFKDYVNETFEGLSTPKPTTTNTPLSQTRPWPPFPPLKRRS